MLFWISLIVHSSCVVRRAIVRSDRYSWSTWRSSALRSFDRSFISFQLNFVSQFRYLGHMLSNNMNDDDYKNIKNLLVRTNIMLISRFHRNVTYAKSFPSRKVHTAALISVSSTQPDTSSHCETTASASRGVPAFAGTHCAYPRRDGQAELTWVAWLHSKMVRPSSDGHRPSKY